MIASLPMYDLVEVRAHTDAIWAAISKQLRTLGIDAPPELTRPIGPYLDHWRQTNVLMSQTCGYPLVRDLGCAVDVIGSFATIVDEPNHPGWYRSVIVCRADDARAALSTPTDALAGFRSARVLCAANGPDSLSGWISLGSVWGVEHGHIPAVLVTGGHVASLEAVTDGRADIASVDAWTLHLLGSYRPELLTNIMAIELGPLVGITPLICSVGGPIEELRAAVQTVCDSGSNYVSALGIVGFVPRGELDYEPILELAEHALRAYDSSLVVRNACTDDIRHLGPIDLASNQLFIDNGHPEFETDESIPVEVAERAIVEQRLFAADVFAADGTSNIVGWVLITRTGEECSIGQISIHPDVAQRGYGSLLLDATIRTARAQREPTLVLSTQSDIAWNQPWYERFGFVVVAEVDWTPGMREVVEEQSTGGLDWSTRVHMRLML